MDIFYPMGSWTKFFEKFFGNFLLRFLEGVGAFFMLKGVSVAEEIVP